MSRQSAEEAWDAGAVLWVGIALALAFAIVWFRIGVSFLAARWAQEDGKVEIARYTRAFLVPMWTGAATIVAGAYLPLCAESHGLHA